MKTTRGANQLDLAPFSFQKGQMWALLSQDALKVPGCGPLIQKTYRPRHLGNSGTWPGSKSESFPLNAYSRRIGSQWLSEVELLFINFGKSTRGCWEKCHGANTAKNMKPWVLARCFLSIWFYLPHTSPWMTEEKKQPHNKEKRKSIAPQKGQKNQTKVWKISSDEGTNLYPQKLLTCTF